ncbi:MAG TPA: hypothetical protein VG842_07880, partial [Sediminibacterium sp.]|nr:hypothetical protein [Sediminibacterium sp.]
MWKTLFIFICLCSSHAIFAADSLQVVITHKQLKQGDTLEFSCNLPNYASRQLSKATLNIWIEDLDHHHRWKFRYPMLNGFVAGSLAIGTSIPDGQYAVNFLVQPGLFHLSGKLDNGGKADSNLVYIMIPKDRKSSFV